MTSEDVLAEDIERAIARYMGLNLFPTDEWPEIAHYMARIVEKAYVYSPDAFAASQNAKDLVEAIGEMTEVISRVMV